MARPPLVIGTWGKIKRANISPGAAIAYARFRDYDGVTRQVERRGTSQAAAERELLRALRDRTRLPIEELTPETRMNVLADAWLVEFAELDRSDGTRVTYGRGLAHIRKALGGLQIREATVPAVDRFLKAVAKSSGPSMAAICRVVLQAMLGLAVRQGAISANPVRDAAVITIPKREVKTFGVDAVINLRAELRAWDSGRDGGGRQRTSDLADVVDMILATGVRTGEVLAIGWTHVDLRGEPCRVDIAGTVVHVKSEGMHVQPHPKSETSKRGLQLPPFAVEMLMQRMVSSQSEMVFPSSTGTLRSPNNFRRQWRDFRGAHNYESWVTPKTFRKAVATLVAAEAGVEAASEQLGHASTAITSKHYVEQTHRGPDVRDILQRFGA
ncbi:MAG: site-specific integrase [Microbacteriaceae bacterium]|nr:site-specific integrase [Microbacteriaceae bacterium]